MGPFAALQEAEQYIKVCRSILDEEIPLHPLDRIRNAIINDKMLMELYGEKESIKILNKYQIALTEIKKAIEDNDKEKEILKILEYLRFTAVGEDFIAIPGVLFFESLNNYPFSCCLLGKSTSYTQASLLKYLLEDKKSQVVEISRVDENNPYYEKERYSVLLKDGYYIDPFHYNGLPSSKKQTYYFNGIVLEAKFSDYKRKLAREEISEYLIKNLGIDDLSNELIKEKDTRAKVNKIIEYLKDNYNEYQTPVNFYTINLNGRRIEISKALELFLIANNIEYEIEEAHEKENTILLIKYKDYIERIDIGDIIRKKSLKNKIFTKDNS